MYNSIKHSWKKSKSHIAKVHHSFMFRPWYSNRTGFVLQYETTPKTGQNIRNNGGQWSLSPGKQSSWDLRLPQLAVWWEFLGCGSGKGNPEVRADPLSWGDKAMTPGRPKGSRVSMTNSWGESCKGRELQQSGEGPLRVFHRAVISTTQGWRQNHLKRLQGTVHGAHTGLGTMPILNRHAEK